MRFLIAFPILIVLLILQTVIAREIPLLQGSPDFVMLVLIGWALQRRVETAWHWGVIGGLMVGLLSAVPVYVIAPSYLVVVGLSLFFRQRFWKVSLMVMFIVTFLATLLTQLSVFFYLQIIEVPIPIMDTINLIVLPSILLNLLFATPFYIWMSDLAGWLYPEPLEA